MKAEQHLGRINFRALRLQDKLQLLLRGLLRTRWRHNPSSSVLADWKRRQRCRQQLCESVVQPWALDIPDGNPSHARALIVLPHKRRNLRKSQTTQRRRTAQDRVTIGMGSKSLRKQRLYRDMTGRGLLLLLLGEDGLLLTV